MDSTVIAAIISVLGAGFLAMLGVFMRGLRNDIRTLQTDIRSEIAALRTEIRAEFAAVCAEMHAEFAAVRADIAQLQQAVARLEGIVGEHSRQLSRFADYGERITSLEAAQLSTA
ncbi:hypothetical protein [Candidatus Poriferisodalis sp.]|uniref:hypothetical protein n=1 Tax=Candidatus Poriferisodalis sp. TaxID=3101277 RepID=UPI003C6FA851